MEIVNMYVANDGTRFNNREECLDYENTLNLLSVYKVTFRNKKEFLILMPRDCSANIIYMILGYNQDLHGDIYKVELSEQKEMSNIPDHRILVLEGDTKLSSRTSENLQRITSKNEYTFMDYEDCRDWIDDNLRGVYKNASDRLYSLEDCYMSEDCE